MGKIGQWLDVMEITPFVSVAGGAGLTAWADVSICVRDRRASKLPCRATVTVVLVAIRPDRAPAAGWQPGKQKRFTSVFGAREDMNFCHPRVSRAEGVHVARYERGVCAAQSVFTAEPAIWWGTDAPEWASWRWFVATVVSATGCKSCTLQVCGGTASIPDRCVR